MLIVALCIWALRLLVRLITTHLHLATDASERQVIISTYLSLERSKAPLKEGERLLVFESIFKSATTGLVREAKDDLVPPSIVAVISKWLSGKT